jgi:hypothetical protein
MRKRTDRSRLGIQAGIVAAAFVVTLPAGETLARGGEWQPLEFPDSDAVCGDTIVHATATDNREFYRETTLADGTVRWDVTGNLVVTYFTDSARSVTVNASGPGHLLVHPLREGQTEPDVEVVAHGLNSYWFTAEQAETLGVPQISVSAGPVDVIWHVDGSVEGHLGTIILDVCAELT